MIYLCPCCQSNDVNIDDIFEEYDCNNCDAYGPIEELECFEDEVIITNNPMYLDDVILVVEDDDEILY